MKNLPKILLIVLTLSFFFSTTSWGDSIVFLEDFESYNDETTLADTNCYTLIAFPGTGSGDDGNCTSDNWETDTGSIKADIDNGGNNWGRTVGDGGGLWRINTQQVATEAEITFDYKADQANNATDVWLRYQTQYWLYVIQFDREDNCIVAKRKVPTNTDASNEWGGDIIGGRGAEIANKGVYYVLRVDTGFAGSSCNQDGRTWASQGLDNIVHDATLDAGTVYTFKATIETIPASTGSCGVAIDCAQLKLYRDDVLVLSWTDENDGWNSSKTTTVQADCDADYFTIVTGYQAAWCEPIYAAGKSGIRNDATQTVWIDDFSMVELGAEASTGGRVGVSGKLRIGGGGRLQITD